MSTSKCWVFVGLLIGLLCLSNRLKACDGCGGLSNNSIGLLSFGKANIIGLQVQHLSFQSDNQKYKNQLTQIALLTRYVPFPRLRLSLSIPYEQYTNTSVQETVTTNYWNDITFLADFVLLNTNDSLLRNVGQQISIGSGVKWPIRAYTNDNISTTSPTSITTGTGSIDFFIRLNYVFTLQKIGIYSGWSYKINTTNKADYKFGNQLVNTTYLFYKTNISTKVQWTPYLGFFSEHFSRNIRKGIYQNNTDGYGVFGLLGGNASWNKLNANISYQHPIFQNYANGTTQSNDRFTIGLTYSF